MNVEARLAEGRLHLAEKQYERAAQAYLDVVLFEPGSMVAAVNLLGLKGFCPDLNIPSLVPRTVAIVAPDNPSVLYNQGEIHRAHGRFRQAVRLFRQSLILRPGGRNGWLKLASTKEHLHDLEQVGRMLWNAYVISPQSEQIVGALAGWMLHQGCSDKALTLLERAPAPQAPSLEREVLRIRALISSDRLDDAWSRLEAARTAHPLDPQLWRLRALCLRNQDRIDSAIKDGRRAILIRPDSGKALNQHAMTNLRSERMHDGIRCLHHYQIVNPRQGLTANGLIGSALVELGDVEKGIYLLRKGCVAKPNNAEALSNMCAGYVSLRQLSQAKRAARLGRIIKSDSADLAYNHALAERFSGNIQAALVHLKTAMSLKPDDAVYHFTGGLLELGDGDPVKGISHHRHRWRMPKFSAVRRMDPKPDLPIPVWDGGRLAGTLAIWGEQGVGDELWFAGYLHHAISLADKVLLEVAPHMVKLMERSFPSATVLPRYGAGTEAQLRRADAQRPAGDLFDLFFRPEDSVPVGYLKPNLGLAHELRARYLNNSEAGTRLIGISWSSKKGIAKRSFSAPIEQWGPVLAPSADEAVWGRQPVRFVNLQYGDVTADLETVRRLFGVRVFDDPAVDPLKDLDAAAAQVLAMDGIISVANAIVALAHASGVMCAVATRIDQDDWRYPRLTTQSRWLPNVHHFWQSDPTDWSSALKAAAQDVAEHISRSPGPHTVPD